MHKCDIRTSKHLGEIFFHLLCIAQFQRDIMNTILNGILHFLCLLLHDFSNGWCIWFLIAFLIRLASSNQFCFVFFIAKFSKSLIIIVISSVLFLWKSLIIDAHEYSHFNQIVMSFQITAILMKCGVFTYRKNYRHDQTLIPCSSFLFQRLCAFFGHRS